MFVTYLDSYLGIIEIRCNENFLQSIKIVKAIGATNENDLTQTVKKQLQEYFNYERFSFDLPLQTTTEFKDRVYYHLMSNGYGKNISYQQLANLASSKAVRAVGSAMANNPFFIVVP